MADLNSKTSEVVYEVLRNLYLSDVESYGKAIERETGLTQGQVGDAIRTLKEKNIIEKGKRSQAQYYEINYQGLAEYFKELWRQEETFEDFTEFLKGYTQDYLTLYSNSTIEEMLQDHFLQGLHTYMHSEERKDIEGLDGFYRLLLKKKEVRESPQRFIESGIDNISND